jgi:ribosomal protein S8E
MGISRDSRHKRRLTGGRRIAHQKKRKYEIARPAAMTKMGVQRYNSSMAFWSLFVPKLDWGCGCPTLLLAAH